MRKRKQFTSEFKREALRLMERSGKPAADLARELACDAINCTSGKNN
jgi:transposase-like protein